METQKLDLNDYHRLVRFLERYNLKHESPRHGRWYIEVMLGISREENVVKLAADLVCKGGKRREVYRTIFHPIIKKSVENDKFETKKERVKGQRRPVRSKRY